MADGSLARRYARALVELGREGNNVDELGRDLDRFHDVLLVGGADLQVALGNPAVTGLEKKAVVEALLQRVDLHPLSKNFLRLLVDKTRFGILADIRREYRALADEIANRARAVVTTAEPASAALTAQVRGALTKATGKDVQVEFKVDPTLLGGVVAQVGGTVYDASVRSRLKSIQQALVRGSTPGEA